MPYFESRNEQNAAVVVIDDTYKNMEYFGKGTATTATPLFSTFNQAWYVDVAVSGNNPIIAINGTGSNVALIKRYSSGGLWYFRVASHGGTTSFTYYVFDNPRTGSAADHRNFVIYNAGGEVVFNANQRYLKVLGMVTAGGSFGIPAGKTAAMGLMGGGTQWGAVMGNAPGVPTYWFAQYYVIGSFMRHDGSTIFNSNQNMQAYTNQGPKPEPHGTYTYGTPNSQNNLIIDVTGL